MGDFYLPALEGQPSFQVLLYLFLLPVGVECSGRIDAIAHGLGWRGD